MAVDEIRGDRSYTGNVNFGGTVNLPSGTLTDTMVSASAAIAATKQVGRMSYTHAQYAGTDVVTRTEEIAIARATSSTSGSILTFSATCSTAPTGGDKAFTVDLKRSTGAGAFASILSAVLTFNSTKTSRVVYTATLSSTTFTVGDIFQVVVTTSGSTGSQGQGLLCQLWLDEAPS